MEYRISGETAQALVNYLQSKPFIEVHELIGLLLKLEPIEAESASKDLPKPPRG